MRAGVVALDAEIGGQEREREVQDIARLQLRAHGIELLAQRGDQDLPDAIGRRTDFDRGKDGVVAQRLARGIKRMEAARAERREDQRERHGRAPRALGVRPRH